MKTAMQELKDVISEMIKNGGTEEDLFAVIAHIDNWGLKKEKKQIIDAYGVKTKSGFKANGQFYSESRFGDEYYDKTYNNEKV